MKFLPVLIAGLMSFAVLVSEAAAEAQNPAPLAAERFTIDEVSELGLVAAIMTPSTAGPHPAIIVLGGSEGGTGLVRALGREFAQQGYVVLALSYFGAAGLPATAEEIPLEYFDRAIEWLARQPQVDPDCIGLFGVSKGGEAALLIGSRAPRVRAVAAGVPSGVIWQGIPAGAGSRPTSTWSLGGEPVPYMPYDPTLRFDFTRYMESIYALYSGALPTVGAHPDAIIPVEEINGPVLLISGKDDAMWPSTAMSDMVVARLRARGFSHAVEHLAYENAGHAVSSPPALPNTSGYPDEAVGGSAEGNTAGRTDMWPRLIAFFDTAFGVKR